MPEAQQVAEFPTNACGAICLLNLLATYKVPPVMVSTHGSVVPLAMFNIFFRSYLVKFHQKQIVLQQKLLAVNADHLTISKS